MNLFIRDPQHAGWNAHTHALLPMLGVPGKYPHTPPKAGIKPRLVQDIVVWVNPLVEHPRHFIRTRALCPACGKEFAASRLRQHARVHAGAQRIVERRLDRRSGSEGPAHDPYSFEERTVTLNGVRHTLHLGLACWYEVNGKRLEFAPPARHAICGDDYDRAPTEAWVKSVGLTLDAFDDAYWRAHPYFDDPMGNPSDYI